MEQTSARSFVRTYLPWIAAGVMLALYVITLNKQVTLASVMPVARGTGTDWHPTLIAPFTWLLTLPIRWLPAGIQLVALNFIGALAAALSLALLARSVSLLPHDRTHDQRLRVDEENALLEGRAAWIAPLFAVLLLGLQRTFWENASICTGETIDVLLMAYVVRCLLEFRLSERDSWLWKMALVYGIGIANDFAFIGFFPALVVALVWLKKLRLFEFTFLVRLVALGLAGLCFYLLLPAVQSLNDAADASFISALRVNLGYQKQVIMGFPHWRAYWLGGYPLVLLLVAAVRWSSGWGDTSRLGGMLGTAMAHVMHFVLLAFAIWAALDLPTSPRHLGLGLPFLGTYYLSALAAGYFAGYLLVVFGSFPGRPMRPVSPVLVPLGYAVTGLVSIVAIAVPIRLFLQNWPKIAAVNSGELRSYANEMLNSLPKNPTTVMSDDPVRLYATALSGGRQQQHLFLESHSLTNAAYLRFLQHKYGSRMPALPAASKTTPVPAYVTISLLTALQQKEGLYYLHPSFGYFFEAFYSEPSQLVYRLARYPTNSLEAPVQSAAVIARQTETWNRLKPRIAEMEARVARLPQLKKTENEDDAPQVDLADADLGFAAASYSQALDWWGVELQRASRMPEAISYFEEALKLNPDNAAAYINREASVEWQKTGKRLEKLSETADAKMKKLYGIESLLNTCGPIDEPSFRIEIMQVFAASGLWRQAAQQVMRALAYAPDDPSFEAALANVYLGWGQPDRAVEIVQKVRSQHSLQSLAPSVAVELARTEATSAFAKNDFASAESILKRAVQQYPEQDGPYAALAQLYLGQAEARRRAGNAAEAAQMLTNAVKVAEQQVRQQPQNASAYFNLGTFSMYLPDFDAAIKSFGKVLDLEPKNFAALLNRAIANLQSKRYDDAQRDYDKALTFTTTSFRIYYGLGEIAYQKKDWVRARDYYDRYLRYAPPNSDESKFVRKRLDEVKSR